jgi:ribosomal silencing factor RsfS
VTYSLEFSVIHTVDSSKNKVEYIINHNQEKPVEELILEYDITPQEGHNYCYQWFIIDSDSIKLHILEERLNRDGQSLPLKIILIFE